MHTIANRITILRIALTPFFVFLLIGNLPYKDWLAAGIFALIAISDGLDGYFARSLNQITDFGKILDPLADKIVISAALLTLVQVAGLPVWAVLAIIGRELAVSGLRLVASRRGTIISASPLGKIKTVTQIVAVFCWIFNINQIIPFINILAWLSIVVAVIFSIVSALDYFFRFNRVWISR